MIRINCPKCSKEYELDEGLDGKVGKCTCGELLEIKNYKQKQLFQIGNYKQESIEFIKENAIELYGFTIIIGILIGIIYSYLNWLGIILGLLGILYFKIVIINYTHKKSLNKEYQISNTTDESIRLYPKSILTTIGLLIRFYLFTIITSLLFFLIFPFIFIAKNPGSQYELLIAILTLLISSMPFIIVIIRYAFVFQNLIIKNSKGLDTVKQNLKQIKGIKKNIFYVNIAIYGTSLVIMLAIWCIYSSLNAIEVLKYNSIVYIILFLLLISELFQTVYITKMFMIRTGINSTEEQNTIIN